jgi:hypothetical protein
VIQPRAICVGRPPVSKINRKQIGGGIDEGITWDPITISISESRRQIRTVVIQTPAVLPTETPLHEMQALPECSSSVSARDLEWP